jgi:hypothetical protein
MSTCQCQQPEEDHQGSDSGLIVNIVNKRKFEGEGVYIGRPSPLGNPFTAKQEGSKEIAISKYRLWLNTQWNTGNTRVINELKRIASMLKTTGEVNLICWCAPAQCHGEVVRDAILNIVNRNLF